MIKKINWDGKDITLSRFTILTGDDKRVDFLKSLRFSLRNKSYMASYRTAYFFDEFSQNDKIFNEFDIFLCINGTFLFAPKKYQECVRHLITFLEEHPNKQIVIATNDYLFLKNCYVEAIKDDCDIRCVDFVGDEIKDYCIKDGISDNSVVNESIETYKREISL